MPAAQDRVGLPHLAPLLTPQALFAAYVLGLTAPHGLTAALCGLGFLVLLLPTLRRGRLLATLLLFGLGAGVGLWVAPPPLPEVGQDTSPEARYTGRVLQVEERPGQRLQVVLDQVTASGAGASDTTAPQSLTGRVLWTLLEPALRPVPGQRVGVTLRLRPLRGMANADTWDYAAHWQRRGVTHTAWSKGSFGAPRLLEDTPRLDLRPREALRAELLPVLRPEAGQGRAVLLALLFGERFFLLPETVELFRLGGVAHSLALSGLHVGLVVLLGVLLARGVGLLRPQVFSVLPRQKLAVLAGAVLVPGYLWLGGFSPSLLRAGLMFFCWGLLLLRGRGNVLLDGLFLAVGCLLLAAPQLVLDIRLQLSAVAVAGIAAWLSLRRELLRLLAARFRRAAPELPQGSLPMSDALAPSDAPSPQGGGTFGPLGHRLGRILRRMLLAPLELLLVSASAQLALMPLVVWQFGELQGALWFNALWLPLLGTLVMPLAFAGLGALLLGLPGVAERLFGVAAWPVERCLEFLAQAQAAGWLPSWTPMRPWWPGWVGYWVLLLLGVLVGLRYLRQRNAGQRAESCPRSWLLALPLALTLLCLPGLGAALHSLERGVSLRLLDVGQGQSLLLELSGGKRLLLDGGGFPLGTFDVGRAVVAPVLTAGRPPWLDWMVLSHADSDHSLGLLYPLRQFRVGRFAANGRLPQEGRIGDLRELLARRGWGTGELWQTGTMVRLGQGVALEVLHPAPDFQATRENDHSLVLRLLWQGVPLALLPGDLEATGLRSLLDSGRALVAQVLVLPHHGGWSGLEGELLDRTGAQLCLASAGFMNRYGFPVAQTRAAAAQQGCPLLCTAVQGGLQVHWDAPAAAPRVESVRNGVLR